MLIVRRFAFLAAACTLVLSGCVSDVNRVFNVTKAVDTKAVGTKTADTKTAGTQAPGTDASIEGGSLAVINGEKTANLCGRVVITECGSEKVGIPQVHLTATNGPSVQFATTDANGYYCFSAVPVGNVSVCVDPTTVPTDAKLAQTIYPSDAPNCQTIPLSGDISNGHFFYERCEEPPPPGPCTIDGSINSNFNGTAVVGVSSGPAYIWFNSNFTIKGSHSSGHVNLTNARVIINGVPHAVPDAVITFSNVGCASTSFDTGGNRWVTTVPIAGSDEIFLAGLAFPVINLPGGARVSWEGTFTTDMPGVCLSWKWGAAAYKFWPLAGSEPDYNAADIKASHSNACATGNSDHAGTPENVSIRRTVTGGARGGGGSNFTGSWSGTGTLCPPCAK